MVRLQSPRACWLSSPTFHSKNHDQLCGIDTRGQVFALETGTARRSAARCRGLPPESFPRARDHAQGCMYRATTSSVHPGAPGSVTRTRRVPTEGAKFTPREGPSSLQEGQEATHLLPKQAL